MLLFIVHPDLDILNHSLSAHGQYSEAMMQKSVRFQLQHYLKWIDDCFQGKRCLDLENLFWLAPSLCNSIAQQIYDVVHLIFKGQSHADDWASRQLIRRIQLHFTVFHGSSIYRGNVGRRGRYH